MENRKKHLIMIESMFFSTGFEACRIAKDLGYKVTLICRNINLYLKDTPLHEHPLGLADVHVEIETNNAESLINFLEEYYKESPFDGIVTFSDYYVDIVAQVANHFGLPSSSYKSIYTAKNKDLSRLCFQQKEIPSPKFKVINNIKDAYKAIKDIGYPCVVKPTAESSSYGVQCVFNDEELYLAFKNISSLTINEREQNRQGKVLIEEYMDGEEVSVETITINGKTQVLGITSKGLTGWPNFVECEFSFPYNLPKQIQDSVISITKKAIEAIGILHGPCHTEIRLTEDGPKIVEINPRLGGRFISKMIQDSIGVHPIKEVIKLSVGEPIDLSPKKSGGAAWCAVTASKTGVLNSILGNERVLSSTGVRILTFNVKIGSKVKKPSDNGDAIGYIYVIGKDANEAKKHLKTAREKLTLSILEEP